MLLRFMIAVFANSDAAVVGLNDALAMDGEAEQKQRGRNVLDECIDAVDLDPQFRTASSLFHH